MTLRIQKSKDILCLQRLLCDERENENTHTNRSTYFAPKAIFFGDLLRINMAPLWQLRVYGNLKEVLAGGEEVNCKDEENWTALMCAMHNETFVIQPTVDLNCNDTSGQTALHEAAFFLTILGL